MKTLTLVREIGALASWFGPSLLVFGAETTFGSRDFFPNPPAPQTTCETLTGAPSASVEKTGENDNRLYTNRDECIDSAPLTQGPTCQDDEDNLLSSLQRKIQRQKQKIKELINEKVYLQKNLEQTQQHEQVQRREAEAKQQRLREERNAEIIQNQELKKTVHQKDQEIRSLKHDKNCLISSCVNTQSERDCIQGSFHKNRVELECLLDDIAYLQESNSLPVDIIEAVKRYAAIVTPDIEHWDTVLSLK